MHNKVISGTEKLKSGLSKADNVISEVAQNFRLNIGVEPQLVSGAFKATDSQLVGKITNKLDDIAKASKSHIDDVVKNSKNLKVSNEVVENIIKESDKVLTEVKYGEHIVKGPKGKKELLPNAQYVTDVGYKYTTDSLGRISSVQADDLLLEVAERNLYSQRIVGGADRLIDDDGGHLIASMFKGSGDIDNLVAMNQQINRSGGVWYEMEQTWRKALEEVPPKKVSVNINAIYDEGLGTLRPSKFRVNYQIEGEDLISRVIMNRVGG